MNLSDAFPLPYAHWYAARLFMDAGVEIADVLARVGISEDQWDACRERYSHLYFADTGWVAHSFERSEMSAPETDAHLFTHLTGSPAPAQFSMQAALKVIRQSVEADPKIGPFADVSWTAQYLCERHFPTITYVHNGAFVCVNGQPLKTKTGKVINDIDLTNFRKIGERWFTDGRRVYGQGEKPTSRHWFVVRGADPQTFRVLNERYAADANAGYYITNLRLSAGDPGSFEVIAYPYGDPAKMLINQSHYAKDSHKVYGYGVEIDGADADSFAPIGFEGRYFADKNRVYWERTPIESADLATFTCAIEVGQYRAFDKDHTYYAGRIMSAETERDRWAAYFKERPEIETTWWHQSPDTEVRTPIGGPYFSDGAKLRVKYKNPRRREWVSIDYIDHDSFQHVVDVFGIDRSGLRYVEPRLEGYERPAVKGAAPESFKKLADGWYQCANQAYFMNLSDPRGDYKLVIAKAEMSSFQVLGGAYAMDAKGLIVEGVRKRDITDPVAVKPIGHLYARMGDTVLYRGKVVKKLGDLDLNTLHSPTPSLLIDHAGFMLLGSRYRKPIAGIKAAKLRFITPYFATDDCYLYVLTHDGLIQCQDADLDTLKIIGSACVSDARTQFSFGGMGLQREAVA